MARRVDLDPKLDTAATAGLRDQLLAAEGSDVVLDASRVELLGASCLELVMGAAALWRQAGHRITVENPSPQMVENLGRYGLSPETMLGDAA